MKNKGNPQVKANFFFFRRNVTIWNAEVDAHVLYLNIYDCYTVASIIIILYMQVTESLTVNNVQMCTCFWGSLGFDWHISFFTLLWCDCGVISSLGRVWNLGSKYPVFESGCSAAQFAINHLRVDVTRSLETNNVAPPIDCR